ncbi:CheR family methyltransferase [Falsiroseomonas sp.]|uniref:CheR family methyltransferase n=1 Tax=Falsiroseomonas sp. TaxID=2870721 RepID=UPI0027343752|nr:CheR family methyltransferase [Falsiroseomonas sp.]MDP3418196.1 CheR family methyltransferase [Falsiroseomonas sp.]
MTPTKRFPIVGIGASAGGVEALQGLFRAMPVDHGIAFVVITHLGPGRESELPAILASCTAMPVTPARDGEPVLPNHVHVLPNDGILTIANGQLRLQAQSPAAPRERQPIDIFLASLAQDQGECAVGIILSGGGSDGALGVKAIKEHGGLTLAQGTDGTAPRHSSMPTSAIATGTVDLVLPVEDMPARLVEFAQGLSAFDSLAADDKHRATAKRLATARGAICSVLRGQVGHDFSGYKEKTFLRRVRRRMLVRHISSLDAYVEFLRREPDEVVALFRDLLINVTGFFRDAAAFEALATQVLPALFEARDAEDSVRVWVPGCSTGEEVYSIAILLCERMEGRRDCPRVQIFATDIDEPALAIARAGRYPAPLLKDMAPARLARFFADEGAAYVVTRELRDLCTFSSHSLIRDPPFSRIDLISCRNLLIYLDGMVQERVIPTFHYALKPGGFLFLGISENVTRHDDLFAPMDKTHRIFRRRDNNRAGAPLPALPLAPSGQPWFGRRPARPARAEGRMDLRQEVENLVLEQFAPAYVVVDREGDIVLQSGRLGRYVEPAPGVPSRQLIAMARRGLRLELRAALREAMETRRKVVRPRVEVEVEDRIQAIELTVSPLPSRDSAEPIFVVLFTELGPPVPVGEHSAPPATGGEAVAMAQLEHELREIRERLQSTIEEYETAVEELRSANEEMVSVNEELQSTNEELETAKEEQQSVNEELQTVNLELAGKVEELDRANADLRNLFESTRIATLFLDRNLLIRSFTPAMAGIFNLIPADRGRPLADLASHLDGIDMQAEVEGALARREPVERRVTTHGGARHHLMRLLPYRAVDGEVDGVLVTFVDVSRLVETENQLRTLIAELNHRVRNMLQVVTAVATHTLREAPAPQEFADSFGGRLRALGRAHNLVSRENWGDVQLHELIKTEIEPYATQPERFSITGPQLPLGPKMAVALGMAVHELATNAVKYGSLSVEGGRVVISWLVEEQDNGAKLVLHWREEGGPHVKPPTRRGFGSNLVERQVRYDLRGTIEMDFQESGLQAVLTVPLPLSPFAPASDAVAASD